MNELTPAAAKAIADILKEVEGRLLQKILVGDEWLKKELEHRIEFARLDSDLWREQSKNKLADLDSISRRMEEACADYEDELLAMQEQNAQLIDDYAKAASQRLTPRGGFKKDTKYHQGNVVLRDGAAWWHFTECSETDPRDKTGDWRLLSMRGARGDKGDRGQKGEPGEPGQPGRDGISIMEGRAAGFNLAFAMTDGTALHVDLEPLREAITQIVRAEIESAKDKEQ